MLNQKQSDLGIGQPTKNVESEFLGLGITHELLQGAVFFEAESWASADRVFLVTQHRHGIG